MFEPAADRVVRGDEDKELVPVAVPKLAPAAPRAPSDEEAAAELTRGSWPTWTSNRTWFEAG